MTLGREFLKYAKATLAEENYRSAVYLSCVAEFEFSRTGNAEGLLEAMQFTGLARAHLINEMEVIAHQEDQDPTEEYFSQTINDYCEHWLRDDLRAVMNEFPIIPPTEELPEGLVSTVEFCLKEIPTIKHKTS